MTRTMIDSDFPYVSSVSFFLLSLVIMECPAFVHAERKRSIYGIAQQSNVSTLREILHFVQNDVVVCVIARRASPDVAISS